MKDRKKNIHPRKKGNLKTSVKCIWLRFFLNLYGKRKKSFKGKGQKENQASKI